MTELERVRHFTHIRTLCEGALELPAEQRAGWLARMCEGDAQLIGEAEGLLRRIAEGGVLAEIVGDRERERGY